MNLDLARHVADAVLYEGYLLYPYRASSSKNQVRWQFGVLGPPGAEERALGEAPGMRMECVLRVGEGGPHGAGDGSSDGSGGSVVVHLRFLQLQHRQVLDGSGRPVARLTVDGQAWTSWDEAVERELRVPLTATALGAGGAVPLEVEGGEETETLRSADGTHAGTLVRRRWPLSAELEATWEPFGNCARLSLAVANTHAGGVADKDDALRRSFLGAHLLVEAGPFAFVSVVDPPADAADVAQRCRQDRCWPFLTGDEGETDLLLGSPIILYDYPQIAEQSPGALFDATEIDEILTLRVITMTDEEKAEARATDPRAAEIIDRSDALSAEELTRMHGVLRNPHAFEDQPGPGPTTGADDEPPVLVTPGEDVPDDLTSPDAPWWDPAADESVDPDTDTVLVEGVAVSKGSLVRVHPQRRADAQDLFFADQVARVTAVVSDVDGGTHVALVLADDPAADLHDWYGRYFYFAPDEVTPLTAEEASTHAQREESRG